MHGHKTTAENNAVGMYRQMDVNIGFPELINYLVYILFPNGIINDKR